MPLAVPKVPCIFDDKLLETELGVPAPLAEKATSIASGGAASVSKAFSSIDLPSLYFCDCSYARSYCTNSVRIAHEAMIKLLLTYFQPIT
jgi:hypothetical protein